MAITNKKEGVWGIDQVYAKQNQGSIWSYAYQHYLWAWGSNNYGQLGRNSSYVDDGIPWGGRSSPVQLGTDTNWKSVSATYGYSVSATKTDGTTWQWARNYAQSGGAYYGDDVDQGAYRSSPVQLPGSWGKVLVTRRNVLLEKRN